MLSDLQKDIDLLKELLEKYGHMWTEKQRHNTRNLIQKLMMYVARNKQ